MNRILSNEELNRKSVEEFKATEKTRLIVVLDNIRSLNNIGSVFRTADAFAIEKIILCGITAKPPHREINKTALGATETVAWEYYEETLDALKIIKKEGYKIASIEQAENTTSLEKYKVDTKVPLAIVFGNEVKGVSQVVVNFSNDVIEIPQIGTKHSLNISVSAGIVMWELFKGYNN